MMQISTSVRQTAEDAAMMPPAVTSTVASRVHVRMDTLEMDTFVRVSQLKQRTVRVCLGYSSLEKRI